MTHPAQAKPKKAAKSSRASAVIRKGSPKGAKRKHGGA